MKVIVISMVALLLLTSCANQNKALVTLTGVVVRKGWTKSMESWNAGGSEYYILKVEDTNLPSDKRTAKEGVILRPSKAIPFEDFASFMGQNVICKGEFVVGEPYIPPQDSAEQMPSPMENPITGKQPDYPIRGSGFKVYVINRAEKK